MKKVLIFSLAYFPKHVGGAEVAIKEITDRIDDVEFHVLTNRFDSTLPKMERLGNVWVHRIGVTTLNPSMADLKRFPLVLNKPLFQFWAVWHAVLLHRVHHFDATWAMMAHSTGVPAAMFKIFFPRVKYILNLQEGDPPEYIEVKMRPLWPLFRRAFTAADVVQPLSTFLATWARRMGYRGRIEVIPNAVDTERFHAVSQKEIEVAQQKCNLSEGSVMLLTTSRLVQKNAVDDVIRAMPYIDPRVTFVVAGTGPDEAMLRALAEEMGVAERVRFIGNIEQEHIPAYVHAADVFIRPSRSEGFGISFVEAMAAGIPVIATQEGGIADFLFDEKRNPGKQTTGWAVDKNAPDQIAAAVRDILARPEKVKEVVETARMMVIEKYDWKVIARTMREKVFTPLLGV
ncbi:MAG: glycosyltransferase family 4 protein [Candidatus Pacebacteria bacterium]|nr:glycosyltransferase family 4 protein [Candidatus Paceibacterota bacterium]